MYCPGKERRKLRGTNSRQKKLLRGLMQMQRLAVLYCSSSLPSITHTPSSALQARWQCTSSAPHPQDSLSSRSPSAAPRLRSSPTGAPAPQAIGCVSAPAERDVAGPAGHPPPHPQPPPPCAVPTLSSAGALPPHFLRLRHPHWWQQAGRLPNSPSSPCHVCHRRVPLPPADQRTWRRQRA